MAKTIREPTALETAQEDLTALRERLDGSQRNTAQWTEELTTLMEQRTSAIPTPEVQRRCRELRPVIEDEEEVGAALVRRIEERAATIKHLTGEQRRNDAAASVEAAEAAFSPLVRQLDITALDQWLSKAGAAIGLTSAADQADGKSGLVMMSHNLRLKSMHTNVANVVSMIKHLKTW